MRTRDLAIAVWVGASVTALIGCASPDVGVGRGAISNPDAVDVGAGRVADGDALRVDPLGATLLLEDRTLGTTPLGVRHRELLRIPGATDRCF